MKKILILLSLLLASLTIKAQFSGYMKYQGGHFYMFYSPTGWIECDSLVHRLIVSPTFNADTLKKYKGDSLYIKSPISISQPIPKITKQIRDSNEIIRDSINALKARTIVSQAIKATDTTRWADPGADSTKLKSNYQAIIDSTKLHNQITTKLSTETDPIVKAIAGIIKSNGSTISAATSTDFVSPNDTSGGSGTKKISTTYQLRQDTAILSARISSTLSNLANQIINGTFLTYQHPRGTTEMYGNANNAYQGVGIQIGITVSTSFNAIRISMGEYSLATGQMYFKIYTSNSQITSSFNPSNLTLLESQVINTGSKQFTQGAFLTYNLNGTHTINAGSYLVILMGRASVDKESKSAIARWTVQSESPLRTGFFFTTNNVADNIFNITWNIGSVPTYCQGSAELLIMNQSIFNPDLIVPDTIRGVIGHELNLWKEALVDFGYKDIFVDCVSDSGYNKERCYRFTPINTDTTGKSIQITVYDRNRNQLQKVNTTLKIYPKNNGSGNKNILIIGNSLIANGSISTEIDTIISTDGGITNTMIGTKGTGDNKHEGISGWKAYDFSTDQFSTVVNPFYFHTFTVTSANATVGDIYEAANGARFIIKTTITGGTTLITQRNNSTADSGTSGTLTKISGAGDATITYSNRVGAFNMKNYMSVNGFSDQLDFACIELGINDAFWSQFTITDYINYIKIIVDYINNVSTGYPNCKIIIALPPYGGNTIDGFGANYGSAYSYLTYRTNMKNIYKNIISSFWTTRYSTKVQLAIPYLMVDRYYGYSRSDVAVSSRNATTIEEITNGVHPEASGYLQIADAFYNVIRSQLR